MKIMLNSRAGGGKDTIAEYLVKKYNFKQVTFATPIYDIAYNIFNMKQKDRDLLQKIGQKMREINPDVWVNYAYKIADQYDNVCLSDVRQANEFIEGTKRGFIPLRINADLDKRIERLTKRDGSTPNLELLENEAETGADDFGYFEIDNNGKLDCLYSQIDNVIKLVKLIEKSKGEV